MARKEKWVTLEDRKSDNWKTVRDATEPCTSAKSKKNKIEAQTENHQKYMDNIRNKTLVFCSGIAGTGKTYIACGIAAQLLSEQKIEKILLTRPIVECGHRLGSLPGDLNDKTGPYMDPMLEALHDFIDDKVMQEHLKTKVIETSPLETMRGRTFHRTMMILDEAQNATRTQLKMFLSRLGKESKVVLCGDILQTDLMSRDGSNAFGNAIKVLDNHKDIAHIELVAADIQRHGLIRYILENL